MSPPTLYDVVLHVLTTTRRHTSTGRPLTAQEWHVAVANQVEQAVADAGQIMLTRPRRPAIPAGQRPMMDPQLAYGRHCLLTCAHALDVDADLILSGSRRRPVAEARQITAYVLRITACLPYTDIGHLLGGLHHTTVLHACRLVERRAADPWWSDRVNACLASLGRPATEAA